MFTTPYPYIDLDILKKNITERTNLLKSYNISSRPHIKSHKCLEIGRMQIEAGAIGITCAKLGEAEVFANGGFDNILIAYNIIGEDKLERYKKLHLTKNIITTIDSEFVAKGLNEIGISSGKKVKVLIEIDLGEDRCGIQLEKLKDFCSKIKYMKGISIQGIMTYHGKIYHYKKEQQTEIREMVVEEREVLLKAKDILLSLDIQPNILSAGSSVASCYPELLQGVTEIRAGNYIFNDNNNIVSGIATEKDCALRVVSKVVSKPMEGKLTLDVGSKVLSADESKHEGYGQIVGHESILIQKLNEEHAMCLSNGDDLQLGEEIEIIPNHSCVIANLADIIYVKQGGKLIKEFKIDARGKSN